MKMILAVALAAVAGGAALADGVSFWEDFALAQDREAAIRQLIPGSEDQFYFACLHGQNLGDLAKVDQLVAAWVKAHGYSDRVREIENRQALLRYKAKPREALDFIIQRLGLRFDHEREALRRESRLPSRLDENSVSAATLKAQAYGQYSNLQGFEDSALDWLAAENLNAERLRDLLRRLKRPDLPNLAKLVADDLAARGSGGFGSQPIHRMMLLGQLEELAKLRRQVLSEANFVHAWLARLRPVEGTDWRRDPAARQAYLERLWAFASGLDPAFNSLKANVLYQRLLHDRGLGVYDKERFMAYLRLPRRAGYVNRDLSARPDFQRFAADLTADFSGPALLPPVRDDEPLVRSYLARFFLTEDSYEPYAAFVHDEYLKRVFAETKIINGLGDVEKFVSWLSPAEYQALKERVDLEFSPANKTQFAPGEEVALEAAVKNVKTLFVKVYQVNAENYYRRFGREVDTDIPLDGLAANEESSQSYEEPPLRQVARTFKLPALKGRGVYVVELIGGGKSSRALVRKGALGYVMRPSVAGHALTVLDEANRQVKDARVWVAGHEYKAGADGRVMIPYSEKPGPRPIVLAQGDFASLSYLNHEAENYALRAGFHVERESLLRRNKASVLVRAALLLNGEPVTLSALEDVTLIVASKDRDGVETVKEAPNFALSEGAESVFEFMVPDDLASLRFALKAKVQNLSRNKKEDLSAGAQFAVNGIDAGEKIEELLFGDLGGRRVLDLVGKNGEPLADRPVALGIKHRDFRRVVKAVLQTDKAGRIDLGRLKDIAWVSAKSPQGVERRWSPPQGQCVLPSVAHGLAGQDLALPYAGAKREADRAAFSLLEVRGGAFVADRLKNLRLEDGLLKISDLPAGDYDLLFKESGARVVVKVAEGEARDGYVLSKTRRLRQVNPKPLGVASVTPGRDGVTIRLVNATPFARVHVFATRYSPAFGAFATVGGVALPPAFAGDAPVADTVYLSGRAIGDEYRYVLERRLAEKLPGNMLDRPGLLLNPWAIRSTETASDEAKAGEALRRMGATGARAPTAQREGAGRAAGMDDFSTLDFLAAPGVVSANLKPNERGEVAIPAASIASRQELHIIAVDPLNTVYVPFALGEQAARLADQRMREGLDLKQHFTERRQVKTFKAGEVFALADISSSSFEVVDSLARLHGLFVTLSGDDTLREFAFVTRWPKLKPEEKLELYSKYACHELSFFLSRKDADFFAKVVKPYIANKREKTFLDEWLLGSDVSRCLAPWEHARLNAVERTLLAQRVAGEADRAARHIKDLFDLIPPDVEVFNARFAVALKGSALDTGDVFGVGEVRDELRRKQDAPPPGAELNMALAGGAAPVATAAPTPAAPVAMMAKASAEREGLVMERSRKAPGKPQEAAADESLAVAADAADKGKAFFEKDEAQRQSARQLYRALDKTQEWVENNYYKLPIEEHVYERVVVNGLWRDFAAHKGGAFLSPNAIEACRNFTEMMFALAVTDLPFEAGEHKPKYEGVKFSLTLASPAIVFFKEILPSEQAADKTPVLVSQNYFRHGDRYLQVDNERVDKFVTDEFLSQTVYGCQVVVTNPTSSRQRLELLLQIPNGAIPAIGGKRTKGVALDLEPYRTASVEYHFYFPASGKFAAYPAHVAKNERLIAFAEPRTLNVVDELTQVDKTSWDYVSQHGTDDDVMNYLKTQNLNRVDLSRMAFRMKDKALFQAVTALLAQRRLYDDTLWSYGMLHNDLSSAREYLKHQDAFVGQCGAFIASPLLEVDPVERRTYQHMEYSPLVNARAHKLGKERKILNDRFREQYERLMRALSCRAGLDNDDLMAVSYYLLLQDRVTDAKAFFGRVKPELLATRLQYDYMAAYLDFFAGEPKAARALAAKYRDYPVARWRKLFAEAAAQLDEAEGKGAAVTDAESRAQQMARLAATEPSLDVEVEGRRVRLAYQNVAEARIHFYRMDVEQLFSRQPFAQQDAGEFGLIRPNATMLVKLDGAKALALVDLPKEFHNSNVVVEVEGGGVRKSKAYYANTLNVQVIETYGQVKVCDAETGRPLPKVYVKAYARMKGGQVKFYKDGYTDLRGKFDYTSLNTNELDFVEKFALLVLSEERGAVAREADPPKR